MNFLPIEINGETVYAGFWKRFGAACIDFFVFLPLLVTHHFVMRQSISLAIICVIIFYNIRWLYEVYFNYRYGATIGKIAVGIKITFPNGSKIGLKQVFLRSSVSIAIVMSMLIAYLYGISQIDSTHFYTIKGLERIIYIRSLFPAWYSFFESSLDFWYWGELVVLLFNKRKRAIHDYIAGTVVIDKKFSEVENMSSQA